MLCFTDPELDWDPVMYTIAKPSPGISAVLSKAAPEVDGPYNPEVLRINVA